MKLRERARRGGGLHAAGTAAALVCLFGLGCAPDGPAPVAPPPAPSPADTGAGPAEPAEPAVPAAPPAPPSLLRQSRFPAGLGPGWIVVPDEPGSDPVFSAAGDDATPGPSGFPAARLEASAPVQVFSPPIEIPAAAGRHLVSFSYRVGGDDTWSTTVVGADGTARVAEVQLEKPGGAEGWQRVDHVIEPAAEGGVYRLHLGGTGTVWIDRLLAGSAGAEGKGIDPRPMPSEITLDLGHKDAAEVRVLFDSEEPFCRWTACSENPEGIVKMVVYNAYGDERDEVSAVLEGTPVEQKWIKFTFFNGRDFGPHRIVSWGEDFNGQRIADTVELIVHRLRRPHGWDSEPPPDAPSFVSLPDPRGILAARAAGLRWTGSPTPATPAATAGGGDNSPPPGGGGDGDVLDLAWTDGYRLGRRLLEQRHQTGAAPPHWPVRPRPFRDAGADALLVLPDGQLNPACAVASALSWLLQGTSSAGQRPLAAGVVVHFFQSQSRRVAVVDRAAGGAEFTLPEVDDTLFYDQLGNTLEPGHVLPETRLLLLWSVLDLEEFQEALGVGEE